MFVSGVLFFLPPANIATNTIPQDQISAGSARYSPSDKTFNAKHTVCIKLLMFKVCKSKKNISDFYTNILRVQHKGEFHKIVFPEDAPCLCVGKQLQSQNLLFSDYLRMQMSQVRLLFNKVKKKSKLKWKTKIILQS